MAIDLGLDKADGIFDSKYGLVCAMDVLGVRQKSITDPRGVLTRLLELNKTFQLEKMGQDHKENRDRQLPFSEEYQYYTIDATIDLFILGDTYFIAKRFRTDSPRPIELWTGIRSILRFFRIALELEIPFMMRGAISIGEYYWSHGSSLVVGPAINDAIDWYEKANWIGLHFTPDSGKIAEGLIAELDALNKDLFFEYDVPLKSGEEKMKRMLCIGWPSFFCPIDLDNPSRSFEEGERAIETIFSRGNPPEKYRIKYDNAWNFFKAYRDWKINIWHPMYKREFDFQVRRTIEGTNASNE